MAAGCFLFSPMTIICSINRDSLLNKPLGLNEREKKDLEFFLLSLSDERFNKK